jgi:hypothetical protein
MRGEAAGAAKQDDLECIDGEVAKPSVCQESHPSAVPGRRIVGFVVLDSGGPTPQMGTH